MYLQNTLLIALVAPNIVKALAINKSPEDLSERAPRVLDPELEKRNGTNLGSGPMVSLLGGLTTQSMIDQVKVKQDAFQSCKGKPRIVFSHVIYVKVVSCMEGKGVKVTEEEVKKMFMEQKPTEAPKNKETVVAKCIVSTKELFEYDIQLNNVWTIERMGLNGTLLQQSFQSCDIKNWNFKEMGLDKPYPFKLEVTTVKDKHCVEQALWDAQPMRENRQRTEIDCKPKAG